MIGAFLEAEPSMFICVCNALREADVRRVAQSGIGCEREAYRRLGCRPRCGQCLPYARELVTSEAARPAAA